jgi:mannosyltransferase OCH1-like enzyme
LKLVKKPSKIKQMPTAKHLHQIWLGPKPRPQAAMQTWQDKNPTYTYTLWTESDLFPLRNQKLFDAFHNVYPAQADILRYEILALHGGVYADADSVCLRSLDDQFTTPDLWVIAENANGLIANSFIGATADHPIFDAVVNELAQIDPIAIAAEDRTELLRSAWVLTGPCCLSEVMKAEWFAKNPRPNNFGDVQIYPNYYFLQPQQRIPAAPATTAYACHWHGSTFSTYDDPSVEQAALSFGK